MLMKMQYIYVGDWNIIYLGSGESTWEEGYVARGNYPPPKKILLSPIPQPHPTPTPKKKERNMWKKSRRFLKIILINVYE